MYPVVVTVVAILITIFLLVKSAGFRRNFRELRFQIARADPVLIDISILSTLADPDSSRGGGLVTAWLYFIKTPPGRHSGMPGASSCQFSG